jgi:serine/threonine protein kinase
MPRVFPSFRDAQDVEHTLTFQRRLSKDLLLFSALDEQAREVCVKIVYRPYGENVHRLLSHEGMAPKLLGVSRTDGGPNVIVMEMLNDPWQTLYTFAQCNSRWSADGVQPAIRKRLEEILAKLEAGGFVHGDFRANNIMVNPDDEKLAVLVDFDWAGEAGKVHYPLDRNHSRIQWPGEPASAISVGHDQFMLQTQWASLLNQQFS